MQLDILDIDSYDRAILNVLRRHPAIRNVNLNRESKLNVKTFNLHLKRLVEIKLVDRFPEGRARVFYKMHPTVRDIERRKMYAFLRRLHTDELASLYERRNKISEAEVRKEFESYFSAVFKFLRITLISALAQDRDIVNLTLSINETTEDLREYVVELNKFIQKNDETRAFFLPILEKM